MHNDVLIVDDDRLVRLVLEQGLTANGFHTVAVSSGEEALRELEGGSFDAVVADLQLCGGMDGIELCRHGLAVQPGVPFVLLTGFGSIEAAVAALRVGVYDFLCKPVDVELIAMAVQRAIHHAQLTQEVKRLREDVALTRGFGELIGESEIMEQVFDTLRLAARSDASVLITGESGTGKELIARALHQRSSRSGGPFVAINCAAVPENLLESEFFGHVRGSFTGAYDSKRGLFMQADGGTLFLDEIGNMPQSMQVKLLRVLQERTVRRVGGEREIGFDVRLVAATNDDLDMAMHRHEFREDLYYRINVISIEVPPLRARGNDKLILAQYFLEQSHEAQGRPITGIAQDAAEKLLAYNWPGNVRELQNAMERAVTLSKFDHITACALPENIRDYRPESLVIVDDDPSKLVSLEEMNRRYVHRVLQATGGNRALAARVLKIDVKTLRRKLLRWADQKN